MSDEAGRSTWTVCGYPPRVVRPVAATAVAAFTALVMALLWWQPLSGRDWLEMAVVVVMGVGLTKYPLVTSPRNRSTTDVTEASLAALIVTVPFPAVYAAAYLYGVVGAVLAGRTRERVTEYVADPVKVTFNGSVQGVGALSGLIVADWLVGHGTSVVVAAVAGAVASVTFGTMPFVQGVAYLAAGGSAGRSPYFKDMVVATVGGSFAGTAVGVLLQQHLVLGAALAALVVLVTVLQNRALVVDLDRRKAESILDVVTEAVRGTQDQVRDHFARAVERVILDARHAEFREGPPARDDEVGVPVGGEWLVVELMSPDATQRNHAELVLGKIAAHAAPLIENVALRDELVRQASEDALTGLPNRREFDRLTEQACAAAMRRGRMMAVAFFDLDGFKPVNDRLGHDAGDDLLRQAATAMGGERRAEETFARLGGDEFALLMPEVESAAEAESAARRVAAALDLPFTVAGSDVQVGTSVGVAVAPEDGTLVSDVMRAADQRMYQEKRRKHTR